MKGEKRREERKPKVEECYGHLCFASASMEGLGFYISWLMNPLPYTTQRVA